MSNQPNLATGLLSNLVGLPCSGIEKPSDSLWQFHFGEQEAHLDLEQPWRLIVNGAVRFASSDDGQKFGLPEPLNGAKLCRELLLHKRVANFELRPDVSDLTLIFEDGARLEIFVFSAGYEGWSFQIKGGRTMTALGGGDVAIWGPT